MTNTTESSPINFINIKIEGNFMAKQNYAYFFLREKPVRILVNLLDGAAYVSSLAKKAKMTYSHTSKILNLMEEAGIIEFKKDGKKRVAVLTNKGKELAKVLGKSLMLFSKL